MEQRETRYGHYQGRGLTIVASLQATVSDHTEDQRSSSLARWPQTVTRGRKSVLRHYSNFFRVLKNIPCSFFFFYTHSVTPQSFSAAFCTWGIELLWKPDHSEHVGLPQPADLSSLWVFNVLDDTPTVLPWMDVCLFSENLEMWTLHKRSSQFRKIRALTIYTNACLLF